MIRTARRWSPPSLNLPTTSEASSLPRALRTKTIWTPWGPWVSSSRNAFYSLLPCQPPTSNEKTHCSPIARWARPRNRARGVVLLQTLPFAVDFANNRTSRARDGRPFRQDHHGPSHRALLQCFPLPSCVNCLWNLSWHRGIGSSFGPIG